MAESWLDQIFDAQQVARGGIVRRQIVDVHRLCGGLAPLLAEVRERRFHLVETGDQYIVICNEGAIRLHC